MSEASRIISYLGPEMFTHVPFAKERLTLANHISLGRGPDAEHYSGLNWGVAERALSVACENEANNSVHVVRCPEFIDDPLAPVTLLARDTSADARQGHRRARARTRARAAWL